LSARSFTYFSGCPTLDYPESTPTIWCRLSWCWRCNRAKNDGPMHEALKGLDGGIIHLPERIKDRPDRDRLALRFERFKTVA